MRLRQIEQVDFRRSEQTNFLAFTKENPAVAASLKIEDAILFINKKMDQLVFVHGFKHLTTAGRSYRVLTSQRVRLKGGRWNPLRLADYATDAGLPLEGLRRFADHYRSLTEE